MDISDLYIKKAPNRQGKMSVFVGAKGFEELEITPRLFDRIMNTYNLNMAGEMSKEKVQQANAAIVHFVFNQSLLYSEYEDVTENKNNNNVEDVDYEEISSESYDHYADNNVEQVIEAGSNEPLKIKPDTTKIPKSKVPKIFVNGKWMPED